MTLKVFGIDSGSTAGRAGWTILTASLALGLVGDLLLRAWPWGLNAAIWFAALCVLALSLPRFNPQAFSRRRSYWLWAALVFSVMLAWRASPVLQVLNLTAVFVCLGMVAFRPTANAIQRAGSAEFAASVAVSAVQLVVGSMVLVARYVDWRSTARIQRSSRFAAIGRGLAIAALPVVVFTALFASADVFFRDLLRSAIPVAPEEALSHLFLWLLFAWLAASYLWAALLAERDAVPIAPPPRGLEFKFIEVGVVFGLVDALFLAFIGVQFRYLFGGATRVESSTSLTYAEYARRGFFELVAVAALVALFLLVTHWLLPRGYSRLHRFYGCLAGVLVVLVYVVMASALQRMRLYQDTFGLTELRLYTTVFMGWLCVVFAWLTLTVLRGRRERFAFGGVIAGLAVLIALNALNPDALIVKRNVAIAGDNGDRLFDSEYALSLSPDAVPTIVANFDKIPPADRCTVGSELRRRYVDEDDDWRSWSWGRLRARSAVSSSGQLAVACGTSSRE